MLNLFRPWAKKIARLDISTRKVSIDLSISNYIRINMRIRINNIGKLQSMKISTYNFRIKIQRKRQEKILHADGWKEK